MSITKLLKAGDVTITFNTENINAIFAGIDEVRGLFADGIVF